MQAADLYSNRGESVVGVGQSIVVNETAFNLLMLYKLWEFDFDNVGRSA
jgi:hypothetical protein